ncbi:MAG: CGLD27 family protein [Synechococcaceae cyanobacterium ELA263]
MQASIPCPVPPEQRPLREYEQLLRSWFFIWPSGQPRSLFKPLLISWLLALGPTLLVSSGSLSLRHDPPRLLLAAAAAALLLPLFLLLRQWLGWSYVQRRLVAIEVAYEESGWYDGQIWQKPVAWRQQDLLVATHQVKPVLQRLQRVILLTVALLLAGTGLCQAF